MYHIKEDKRSRKSAELAVKAMDRCLEAHGFEDLTITELCNVSTIGRATFYRLFDNLQDVVAYKCELFAEEFQKEFSGYEMQEIPVRFFGKWMQNIDLLKLIVSLRRTDIIFDCHWEHLKEIMPVFEEKGIGRKLTDYHIIMLTNILVGSLLIWNEHDCKEKPEEVAARTEEAIHDIGLIFEQEPVPKQMKTEEPSLLESADCKRGMI